MFLLFFSSSLGFVFVICLAYLLFVCLFVFEIEKKREIELDGWRGRNNLGCGWRKCDHNIVFKRNLLLINLYITQAMTVSVCWKILYVNNCA